MANAIYPKYKEVLLGTTGAARDSTSLASGVVKAALVDTGVYTYSSAHQFWSSVNTGGAVIGTPQTLASKTVAAGVFDAADVTFTGISGASAEAIVIYIDTAGADTTDPLVAYMDTGVTGLPVTPNSGDIFITWNASGIFAL